MWAHLPGISWLRKSWPKFQVHWFGQSRESLGWEDVKKGSCHRNDIKTMVTKYQNTKSRAVGIHNEVFMGLKSKTARRPVQSIVETAAPCAFRIRKLKKQKESISTEGPPTLKWKGIEFQILCSLDQANSLPLEPFYNSRRYGTQGGSWRKPGPVI